MNTTRRFPPTAVIMARGGSKRVPRKNVRPFNGRPMVAWPVRAALASGLFGQVLISTDDPEIATVACAHGALQRAPRPAELSDDHATTADVLRHTLRDLAASGPLPETCCVLYGTSCMVTPDFLRDGLALLQRPETDLVLAATPFPHPVQRALRIADDGTAFYEHPECVQTRTQDLPPLYHDIGLFYWVNVRAFLDHGAPGFAALRLRALVVPRLAAVDIDTEEDWQIAEIMARHIHGPTPHP
ncbi:cytidylyltransferase family protein [Desulfovibrio sp. A2]|nr:cytidylyltransferase family protein [Desulfovibrio sp. A2]